MLFCFVCFVFRFCVFSFYGSIFLNEMFHFIGSEALRTKLGEMGVNMVVGSATIEYVYINRFDDILAALRVYLSIHGNLNVPLRYGFRRLLSIALYYNQQISQK